MPLCKTIIGKDPALKYLLRNIKLIAPTNVNVLIVGETGTGKELIASAIRQHSRRNDKPFVALNCATLIDSIFEVELFGALKGSYTGAEDDKKGLFEEADGGTLFLDEINSLHPSIQTKLLRFVESGEYLPVGAIKTRKADIRIIAASNCDLGKLAHEGKFREDLFFRLATVQLTLPPLRLRNGDVPELITHFMAYFANKHKVRRPVVKREALDKLQAYSWPGNIRQLRNLCEYLTIQKIRKPIELKDLPFEYRTGSGDRSSQFELPACGIVWEELEADLIRQALLKAHGQYKETAFLLGLSVATLKYRMKKYDIVR